MRIDVVTIFPEYLEPLQLSLVGKAIQTGLVDVRVHDLRSWTTNRHHRVDDTPYGGGAGMVMKPEPWGEALDSLVGTGGTPTRLVVLTPSGRLLTQRVAEELRQQEHLILACGRYEGIDARVVDHASERMQVDEISIGDYVLNGGEAAALVLIETLVRLIPGVIGNPESLAEESHSAGQDGLLEYPVYTKPPVWRGLEVPGALRSGHHAEIAAWRRDQAVARTRARRPDLLPAPAAPHASEGAAIADQLSAAGPDDAGELLTLQRAAFVEEGRINATFELAPLTQRLDELRSSLSMGTVLIIRRSGRLVGSVRGESASDGVWSVGRLMVAPDLRGRGLGSRLMAEIEARAPDSARVVRLITGVASQQNRAFYRRRGYADLEVAKDATGVDVVVLEKALATSAGHL